VRKAGLHPLSQGRVAGDRLVQEGSARSSGGALSSACEDGTVRSWRVLGGQGCGFRGVSAYSGIPGSTHDIVKKLSPPSSGRSQHGRYGPMCGRADAGEMARTSGDRRGIGRARRRKGAEGGPRSGGRGIDRRRGRVRGPPSGRDTSFRGGSRGRRADPMSDRPAAGPPAPLPGLFRRADSTRDAAGMGLGSRGEERGHRAVPIAAHARRSTREG